MEQLLKAVQHVNLERLCECVYLPDSKKHSNESVTRRVLLEYWLLNDPAPSWRRSLQRLDWVYDLRGDITCGSAADAIRHVIEPIQGMLFMFLYV